MRILLVNDDGIAAPGIHALSKALAPLGEVVVLAPNMEQSGVGHKITYLTPIMVEKHFHKGQHFGWAVHGSPADCVKLGILEFFDSPPDLVVSGINNGENVGVNVLASGTVAAAIEGAFFGVTSFAVSLCVETPPDYMRAAEMSVTLIRQVLATQPREGSLWNINFPATSDEGPRGVKKATIGLTRHTEVMERRIDPRGRAYYWSGAKLLDSHNFEEGTDLYELSRGYVTITPLKFNMTDFETFSDFSVDGFTA